MRHNFAAQGGCDNGRHELQSAEPVGMWVWGWGTSETTGGMCLPSGAAGQIFTCNVSYGYPAGEAVVPINNVYIPPTPG